MFDRRVIRGNTYAIQHEGGNAQAEAIRIQKAQQSEKYKREKQKQYRGIL